MLLINGWLKLASGEFDKVQTQAVAMVEATGPALSTSLRRAYSRALMAWIDSRYPDPPVTLLDLHAEVAAVAELADQLRREAVGDAITWVHNRNINYTNACTAVTGVGGAPGCFHVSV